MGKVGIRDEIRKARLATDDLDRYVSHKNVSVRMAVAENPRITYKYLVMLSEDPDENVRWTVAMNPKTPESCLEKLAKDEKPSVREGIALNPHASEKILAELSEDENGIVRDRALNRIKIQKIKELDDFDSNALMTGMKIKAFLLKDNLSANEVQHICQLILLGKAVENYLNHKDYELREILREGFD